MAAGMDVTFRKARHEDYDDVMRVHDDVFFGMDYLPALYHELLDIGGAVSCLTETKGKAVGFAMSIPLVFRPHCWLAVAARVHPDYQHRGIMKGVFSFMDAEMTRDPIVDTRTTYFAQLLKQDEIKMQTPMMQGWDIVYTGQCLTFEVQISSLKKTLEEIVIPPRIKEHLARSVKANSTNLYTALLSKILPEYFMTRSYWHVHRNNPEDVARAVSSSETLVTTDACGKIKAASFSNTLPAKMGTRNEIYFHGENISTMLAHLILQYKNAVMSLDFGKLGVRVHFARALATSDVTNFLVKNLGFTPRPDSGIAIITKEIDSRKSNQLSQL